MVVYFRRIRYSEQVSLALPQAPRKKVEKGIFVGIIALFKMNYAWYFGIIIIISLLLLFNYERYHINLFAFFVKSVVSSPKVEFLF